MVRLTEAQRPVGSPMKVFLLPRVNPDSKIPQSPDSARSTASGGESSNGGIDSAVDFGVFGNAMTGTSAVQNPMVENYSEWSWSPALHGFEYGSPGEFTDLHGLRNFEPFEAVSQFPLSDQTGAFMYPPTRESSLEEALYEHSAHQNYDSTACSIAGVPLPDPYSGAPFGVDTESFGAQLGSYTELPSVGSAPHFEGSCKPCAFAYEGCANGSSCQFCHLCPPGELKRRKREKLAVRRKLIRQQQGKWNSR